MPLPFSFPREEKVQSKTKEAPSQRRRIKRPLFHRQRLRRFPLAFSMVSIRGSIRSSSANSCLRALTATVPMKEVGG